MNLLFIQNEAGVTEVVETVNEPAVVEGAPVAEDTVTEVAVEDAEVVAEQEPSFFAQYSMWFMILGMIAIMYFFMWRPESKRRKQMQEFRQGLKKGDKIITAGGIYGVIKEVHETSLLIEVDSNVTLRIDKNMVVGDPTQGIMQQ
jgi:preprotein translocase subunit YajC